MKRVLVTGAAKGLGPVIAERLAREGYSVVSQYRTSSEGLKGSAIRGDFSTPESTRDFIARYKEEFPGTVGVVNNVGHYITSSALETSDEEFLKLFQANVFAPLQIVRALQESLETVVNIGSAGVTHFKSEVFSAAYMMSKQSLYSLTLCLARELAPRGVRVNMVSPGIMVNTVEGKERPIPMGRLIELEEVAAQVVHLFKAECRSVTGQNIEVAGGFKL